MRFNFHMARNGLILVAVSTIVLAAYASPPPSSSDLIDLSRSGCVRILSASGDTKGTGFFVAPQVVATSLDAVIDRDKQGWTIAKNLTVKLIDGEEINATVASVPTGSSPDPLIHNFGVLRLNAKPRMTIRPLPMADDESAVLVEGTVLFSGYPLQVEGLVTMKGMISGWSPGRDVFYIQAPVPAGFSGTAVISSKGTVLGIINTRMDRMSREVSELKESLDSKAVTNSTEAATDDRLAPARFMVKTLESSVTTGIGVVIPIRHLKGYLAKFPVDFNTPD